ncbi:MAG: hypothetical protein AAF366_17385 [Pseudomonadota bacterium]
MDDFDPSVCPGDHQGAVAVRVESGYAFRMPAEVFSVRDPLPPPVDAALPRYGCPGNPIIARAVSTYMGMTQFLPEGFEPHREMRRPVSLTIFGHDGPMGSVRNALQFIHEGPNGNAIARRCFVARGGIMEYCNLCGRRAEVVDERLCRYERTGRVVRLEDHGFWARSLPGRHPESADLPLVAICRSARDDDPTRNFARNCRAYVVLQPDLVLRYGYDGNVVTLPMLPEFDLAIRDWIESRRAPELDGPARNIFEERR